MPINPTQSVQGSVLKIPWITPDGQRRKYSFFCEQELRTMFAQDEQKQWYQARFKAVYYGYFLEDAPAPLESGVYYYLKHIHALPNDYVAGATQVCSYPQTRERHELLRFEGSHLRQLLACNGQALEVRRELSGSLDCTENDECYIVEQPYSMLFSDDHISQGNLWEQLEKLTVWERLDYMEQICMALTQLYRNTVNGKQIIAHRDVKVSNCLIERERNRFIVRLTDFATIRFDDDADPRPRSAGAVRPAACVWTANAPPPTSPFIMSPENTAPESLDPDMPITSQVDIYALGTVLASLFGYASDKIRNPNYLFCKRNGWEEDDEKLRLAFLANAEPDRQLGMEFSGTSWMEQALPGGFHWGDHPGSGCGPAEDLLLRIRALFFHATRIDPESRITLQDFLEEIRSLKAACEHARSDSRLLYDIPEPIYLFHQRGLHTTRPQLIQAAEKAMAKDNSRPPLRADWYLNPDDKGPCDPGNLTGNTYDSSRELLNMLRTRPESEPVGDTSLTAALHSMYLYYHSKQYEASFNGIIRIFTCEKITPQTMPDIDCGNEVRSFAGILDRLYDLPNYCGETFAVYLHTPEMPLVPDNAAGSCRAVRMAPPESRRRPQDPPADAPVHQKPDPAPEIPPEKLYITRQEGLFFLQGQRKVYVSRRNIRR